MKLTHYYFGMVLIAVTSITSVFAEGTQESKTKHSKNQHNKNKVITMDVIAQTPHLSNIIQYEFDDKQEFTVEYFTTSGINIRNKDGGYSQKLVPVSSVDLSSAFPKTGDQKTLSTTATENGRVFNIKYEFTFMKRSKDAKSGTWVLTYHSRNLHSL